MYWTASVSELTILFPPRSAEVYTLVYLLQGGWRFLSFLRKKKFQTYISREYCQSK